MRNRGNYVLGFIFVILGGLFLLKNLDIFDFSFNIGYVFANFWPMFIIIPGIMMHSSFFSGKNHDPGILVPGGIFLTVGIVCQISMLYDVWDLTWPGFILAVAVGLFELYVFGSREKGILVPVAILTTLSTIFFVTFSLKKIINYGLVIPGAFILVGLVIIFNRGNTNKF